MQQLDIILSDDAGELVLNNCIGVSRHDLGRNWDGPGGNLAQESLEFAEGHLDRVQIGGILRQIAKGCSRGLNRLTNAGDFVGSKIIDHHDVVSLQCWHEAMFDISRPAGRPSMPKREDGERSALSTAAVVSMVVGDFRLGEAMSPAAPNVTFGADSPRSMR
jgi:hypothetical protein